jgi:hypothetical protein
VEAPSKPDNPDKDDQEDKHEKHEKPDPRACVVSIPNPICISPKTQVLQNPLQHHTASLRDLDPSVLNLLKYPLQFGAQRVRLHLHPAAAALLLTDLKAKFKNMFAAKVSKFGARGESSVPLLRDAFNSTCPKAPSPALRHQ